MNKRNKIIVVLLSLIVVALAVMILSNVVIKVTNEGSFRGIIYNSTSGDKTKRYIFRYVPKYNGVSDYNALVCTYDLSYFAADNGRNGGVANFTPGQIYAPNATEGGLYVANVEGDDVEKQIAEIWYRSTICIFHTQSTTGSYVEQISNVVDIQPGKLVVYKYSESKEISTGIHGTQTVNGNTIKEIVSFRGKMYEITYQKAEIDISTLADTQEDNLKMMSALMNIAMNNGLAQNGYIPSEVDGTIYTTTNAEAAVHYYWQEYIKDIVKQTGLLDPHFDVNKGNLTSNDLAYNNDATQNKINQARELLNQVNYQPLTKGTTTQEVGIFIHGDNAYIGPLNVNYQGGNTSIIVTGNSGEMIAKWATRNADGSFNSIQTGNITSGQAFYAVVNKSKVNNVREVNVAVKLSNIKEYSARFVLSNNKYAKNQNLMYFTGIGEDDEYAEEVSWTVESTDASLRIQKLDPNGNALNLSGIEFGLYEYNADQTLKYIGTLTTTSSGQTNTIEELEKGKKYVIMEFKNIEYGYKNINITNPTITTGSGTITPIDYRTIEITLDSDAIISIGNRLELGEIVINKKGDTNLDGVGDTNLQNVKFTLQRDNKYIQLRTENNEIIYELSTDTSVLDIAACTRYYVNSQSEATKFKTDSLGQIKIKNLEIYSGINTKYQYTVREVENTLYGYKAMYMTDNHITYSEVENPSKNASLKQVTFNLVSGKTSNITMINPQYLGKIDITKENSENQVLPNVEFVIYKAETANTGYMQLKRNGASTWETSLSGTININDYDITYLASVNKNDATKFVTDANGKSVINGLEVYSGVSSTSVGTKYNYYIEEISNSNYGNKNANIINADIRNGTLKSNNGREIDLQLSEDNKTEVDLVNATELFNLTLNKLDKENSEKKLKGVQFAIYQAGTGANGWLKLVANNGAEQATISQEINIRDYQVSYVNNVSDATKFETNTDGQIVIKNLERYCGKNSEYIYYIRETSNNLYGYKAMIMDDVSCTGCKVLSETNQEINEGDPIVDDENKQIKIKATTNSVNITIKNTLKLGNLAINKKDGSNNLQNVEFVVYKGGEGYLVIDESTVSETDASTAKYTETLSEATKFKTNSSGQLVFNNLEIYNAPNSKYYYIVREVSNNNYGYKEIPITTDNVELQGGTYIEFSNGKHGIDDESRRIKFTIDDSQAAVVTLNIENIQKLGNINVTKVNQYNEPVEGAEFKIKIASGQNYTRYVALYDGPNIEERIESIKQEVIIISVDNIADKDVGLYRIEYVENESEATSFITNESGKIRINNFEVNKSSSSKYTYIVYETSNKKYGYGFTNGADVKESTELVQGQTAQINFENTFDIGNIKLQKVNQYNEPVEGVEFKIKIASDGEDLGYIAIYNGPNENDRLATIKKGIITINLDNVANADLDEYRIKYVADESKATTFITNSSGLIGINNLETNKSPVEKYSYIAYEKNNPIYGYGSVTNNNLIVDLGVPTDTDTNTEENTQILKNTRDLGNIKLNKMDEDNQNIKLANVGFVIQITPAPSKQYAYLALYDDSGTLQTDITGTVTINNQNKAKSTEDGKEYEVRYYCTDEEYSNLENLEKNNITTFFTDENGTLNVNNLEVYSNLSGEKNKYSLKEVENQNYGYEINSEITGIELETDRTNENDLTNKQIYTKISGYVWEENSTGKANEYDGLYKEKTNSDDIKLNEYNNGKLATSTDRARPVEILLRYKNPNTEEIVQTKPDEFNAETGKYVFEDIEIAKLEDYEMVFIYDGFYYMTLVPNLEKDNGSKVKEVSTERTNFSNLFGTVKQNDQEENVGKIVSKDGTIENTIEYQVTPKTKGQTSTVSRLEFDTSLTAKTSEAGYDLKKAFDDYKQLQTMAVDTLDNVNMGIVTREQPKVSVSDDVNNVLVNFAGKDYNYIYDVRGEYSEEGETTAPGVQFAERYGYTQTLYRSDLEAVKAGQTSEMKVYITYKIGITNKSSSLIMVPKEIKNYFDSRYGIIGVELGEVKDNKIERTGKLNYSEAEDVNIEGLSVYKSTIIDFKKQNGEEIQVLKGETKYIFITFELSGEAILNLLNKESTYYNATEIISYATYYGKNTNKNSNGEYYTSDNATEGSIYAGIDIESQPGNIELKFDTETKKLDESKYEPDTSSAPSLLLKIGTVGARMISGNVWEDLDAHVRANEKLGNGKYDSNERPIEKVTVELHIVNDDGTIGEIATYSNGELAVTQTDTNGKYTLGYYSQEDDVNKNAGVLPGRYVIKYIYNNESYIVGKENINVNDYKSTIITSDIIKDAIVSNNERWFVTEEKDGEGNLIKYSDAIDDFEYRKSLEKDKVNYENYKDTQLASCVMNASTPIMDIGLEFTEEDTSKAIEVIGDSVKVRNYIGELTNVDFGIIERPDVDISIEKEISALEVTTSTGMNIISISTTSDFNSIMQGVKKLEDLIVAEVEANLLQGATLKVEYKITVQNNSQIDYADKDYYYYGIPGTELYTPKVEKVVDYLDATMTLNNELNEDGVWEYKTAQELRNEGLISPEVEKELGEDYHILVTEKFSEATPEGEEVSVKLYAIKPLAAAVDITESNRVEIIELSGGRTIKKSTPGNHVPVGKENIEREWELDEDRVDLIITPPTGTSVNYIPYMIATIVTLLILTTGIIIIKKRLVK